MRISVKPGDPGYNTWQDFSKARVTLDGERILSVVTADELLGFVTTIEWDYTTGKAVEIKHRGKVEITFVWD